MMTIPTFKDFLPSIQPLSVEDMKKEVEETIAKIAKIEWKGFNQTGTALVPSAEDLHRLIQSSKQIRSSNQILGDILKETLAICDIWTAEQDQRHVGVRIFMQAIMINYTGIFLSEEYDSEMMPLVWESIPWQPPVPQVPQEILDPKRREPATNFSLFAYISHRFWQYVRDHLTEKYGREKADIPPPPLKMAIRTWQQEQTAKPITAEYDRKYSVAVLKQPLGSVRELALTENDTDMGEMFKTPERVAQVQMELDLGTAPSKLPAIMPLQVIQSADMKRKTKSGAVSHELRIFHEAVMALQPNQRRADLMFRLGDMIYYLYPHGKFNWTNQMPHIKQALATLHNSATIPWIDDQGNLRQWRPVSVRAPLPDDAKRETPIFIDVQMPPDATRGHMVIKKIHRLTAMKSAARWNAYHVACYLWDKYGTVKGKLVDPTRPIERRDVHNRLVDATGKPILTRNGKEIKSPYHKEAIPQLDREMNPDTLQRYPVLSYEELIRACYPNGYPAKSRREYLQRTKKNWRALEVAGYIVIHKAQHGWRILPRARI